MKKVTKPASRMASDGEQVLRGLPAVAADAVAAAIFALRLLPLMWVLPCMRWAAMAYYGVGVVRRFGIARSSLQV